MKQFQKRFKVELLDKDIKTSIINIINMFKKKKHEHVGVMEDINKPKIGMSRDEKNSVWG